MAKDQTITEPQAPAETQEKPVKAKKSEPQAPAAVILTAKYDFFDEAGELISWAEGFVETEAARIKMLIERKAPIKEHANE